MVKKLKDIIIKLHRLFSWLLPFLISILVIYLPIYFLKLSFGEFIRFIEILVWPVVTLIILFFFKKVVTYLFFSMDQFNFFGIKGDLKNVTDVIEEEVQKKFIEEKKERERKIEIDKLSRKIFELDNEKGQVQGRAKEYLDLAKTILKEWKDANKVIMNLTKENRRLHAVISKGFINEKTSEAESSHNSENERQTSNPVNIEEGNINIKTKKNKK